MIYTQRQLEDLLKAHGRIILPYRARLTPLAKDWIRQRRIAVGYGDGLAESSSAGATVQPAAATIDQRSAGDMHAADFYWWCDSPCGATKAALVAQARDANMSAIDLPADPKNSAAAIARIARAVKSGGCIGGIIVVERAARTTILAGRCRALLPIVGTSRQTVEEGVNELGANLLIIEHPKLMMHQARNLMIPFVRPRVALADSARQTFAELESCG